MTDNGVGSFAGGHGEPGPLVGEKGTLSYFEVCARIILRFSLECYDSNFYHLEIEVFPDNDLSFMLSQIPGQDTEINES